MLGVCDVSLQLIVNLDTYNCIIINLKHIRINQDVFSNI